MDKVVTIESVLRRRNAWHIPGTPEPLLKAKMILIGRISRYPSPYSRAAISVARY